MSSDCIKNPPCYFCFQKDQRTRKDQYNFPSDNKLQHLIRETWKGEEITVCYEYSGYYLADIDHTWYYERWKDEKPEVVFTMTTMPEAVTAQFIGYVKNNSPIRAIALSYDSEKCSKPFDWYYKANLLKEAGFKVSCNYLLEPYRVGIYLTGNMLNSMDQLNLLSYKPTGEIPYVNRFTLKLNIEELKPRIPIALDNCLGYQLGYTDKCHKGEDFIHVLPDGTITDCCFKEKCYLYEKQTSRL